jgi:hypothetical protein
LTTSPVAAPGQPGGGPIDLTTPTVPDSKFANIGTIDGVTKAQDIANIAAGKGPVAAPAQAPVAAPMSTTARVAAPGVGAGGGITEQLTGALGRAVPNIVAGVAAQYSGAAEEAELARRSREEQYRLAQQAYARQQELAAKIRALGDRNDPEALATRAAVQQQLAALRATQQTEREFAGRGYNEERLRGIRRRGKLAGARAAGLGATQAAAGGSAAQAQIYGTAAGLYGQTPPAYEPTQSVSNVAGSLGNLAGGLFYNTNQPGNLWGGG